MVSLEEDYKNPFYKNSERKRENEVFFFVKEMSNCKNKLKINFKKSEI